MSDLKQLYATITYCGSENPITISIPNKDGRFFDNYSSLKRIVEVDRFEYEGTFLDIKDLTAQKISTFDLPPDFIILKATNTTSGSTFTSTANVSADLDYAFRTNYSGKFSCDVPGIGEVQDFYNITYSNGEGEEGFQLNQGAPSSLTFKIEAKGKRRTVGSALSSPVFTEYNIDYPFSARSIAVSSTANLTFSEKYFLRLKIYMEPIE